MKNAKMDARVISSKLVAVLVAILVTVMSGGVASGLECVDCHSGNSISTAGAEKCPGGDDQEGHNVFLGKVGDNASLVGLDQLSASTYYVPNDFPAIQQAIDAAMDGDEIIVQDGIYDENIRFWGKAITVRSANGPANTTIQGVEGSYPDCGAAAVVTFWNGEGADSLLDGFTITNGNNGGFGGGIASYASSPILSNCIITGNTGYWGGGIFHADWGGYSAATITNCIIINNNASGDTGGGVYCGCTSPMIVNCTISGNSAATTGGAIRSVKAGSLTALPAVVNSILWGNSPDEISIDVAGGCSIDISYSDIQGGDPDNPGFPYPGTDNIDDDPLFVGGGDYHLTTGSPCIDTGTDDIVTYPNLPTDDIDGDFRPQGIGYDMGADESVFCTDNDNDGFYAESGCGTPIDCNDNNDGIYPGAPETKHDGIDQDCNGYDLTIDIITADYNAGKDELKVEATSSLGAAADLVLEGYGPMSWYAKKAKWTIAAKPAGGDPGTVTVSGIEGKETVSTGGAGGTEKNCKDGEDNDGDGLTDCDDPDCSGSKWCP